MKSAVEHQRLPWQSIQLFMERNMRVPWTVESHAAEEKEVDIFFFSTPSRGSCYSHGLVIPRGDVASFAYPPHTPLWTLSICQVRCLDGTAICRDNCMCFNSVLYPTSLSFQRFRSITSQLKLITRSLSTERIDSVTCLWKRTTSMASIKISTNSSRVVDFKFGKKLISVFVASAVERLVGYSCTQKAFDRTWHDQTFGLHLRETKNSIWTNLFGYDSLKPSYLIGGDGICLFLKEARSVHCWRCGKFTRQMQFRCFSSACFRATINRIRPFQMPRNGSGQIEQVNGL